MSVTDFDVRLLELVEHLRDGDNTMRRDTYVQSPLGVLLTKPKERINMRYSLPVDLVDWARDEAKALGISASEFVEAQLDAARENWDDIHDDD